MFEGKNVRFRTSMYFSFADGQLKEKHGKQTLRLCLALRAANMSIAASGRRKPIHDVGTSKLIMKLTRAHRFAKRIALRLIDVGNRQTLDAITMLQDEKRSFSCIGGINILKLYYCIKLGIIKT
jgi:hypothetical protein